MTLNFLSMIMGFCRLCLPCDDFEFATPGYFWLIKLGLLGPLLSSCTFMLLLVWFMQPVAELIMLGWGIRLLAEIELEPYCACF